jgi:uncharacterized membrane protein YphA (DoxX/SURF4 family)
LAGCFLVVGASKLSDRARARQALVAFGCSERLAPSLAIAVPIAELVTGIALLLSSLVRWGAISALALLILFTLTICFNLARGRTPDCNCFGQIRVTPIGASTVLRNLILGGVATFVLWSGGRPQRSVPVDFSQLGGASGLYSLKYY